MATKKNEVVEIKAPEFIEVPIRIVGDSPLMVHNWTEKEKKKMLDNAMGLNKGKKKEPKDPAYEYINSFYWIEGKPKEDTMEAFEEAIMNGAKFGVKAISIKSAAVSAAYRKGWSKDKVSLRSEFWILSGEDGLLEIKGDSPIMREDPVTVGISGSDLRYRGEFRNWYIDFILKYDKNGTYPIDALINMINLGGFACGIGEWRVEKGGDFGMYHVESTDKKK